MSSKMSSRRVGLLQTKALLSAFLTLFLMSSFVAAQAAENIAMPLKATKSGRTVKAFGLTFGESTLEKLPAACFKSDLTPVIPSIYAEDNHDPERAHVEFTSFGTHQGRILIDAKKNSLTTCFGSGVKAVTLGFDNGVLTYADIIHESAKFDAALVRAIGASVKKRDATSHKGQLLTNAHWTLKEAHVAQTSFRHTTLESTLAKTRAKAFFKSNGYPRFGDLLLGHSTIKSLHKYLKENHFKASASTGKAGQKIFSATVPMDFFGIKPFDSDRVHVELGFTAKGVLESIDIRGADANALLLNKTEYERVMKDFVYQADLMPEGSQTETNRDALPPLIASLYVHKDYTPEKTHGYALYCAELMTRLGSPFVERILLYSRLPR